MKKILATALTVLLLAVNCFAVEKAVPGIFNNGICFSNWMDKEKISDFNPYFMEKANFENAKAMGCDVVRLYCNFKALSSGTPDFVIDEKLLNRLDEVVDWANELQLYVIIDNHRLDNASTNYDISAETEKSLYKIWAQIAKRYADKGPYICYELYNEPNMVDTSRWQKITKTLISDIRKIDTEHYIVVTSTNVSRVDTFIKLPKYEDSKLIYTFHFYEPELFTSAGAPGSGFDNSKNIPFPYDKEKMPKTPSNLPDYVREKFSKYEKDSNLETLYDYFDKVAEFSVKNNVPVWCGEYGAYRDYITEEDRIYWHKFVSDALAERGIAKTVHCYYYNHGLFNNPYSTKFPEDLNKELVEAIGLKVPEKGAERAKIIDWISKQGNLDEYIIYENGKTENFAFEQWNIQVNPEKKQKDKSMALDFSNIGPNGWAKLNFGMPTDLSELKDQGYYLEIEAMTKVSNVDLLITFADSAEAVGLEWRASTRIRQSTLPADGNYHTIKISLNNMKDSGAYDVKTNTWHNPEGKFDWTKIQALFFSNNTDNALKNNITIKSIKLVQ